MSIIAELVLRRHNAVYEVELVVEQGQDSNRHFGPFLTQIDPARFAELLLDVDSYASALTDGLFSDQALVWSLGEAYGLARGRETPLRLRLAIDPGLEELHRLRWELLCLPGTGDCISLREDILFSRYVPVRLEAQPPCARGELRVLGAIPSPVDIHNYLPQPPDIQAIKSAVQEGLGSIPVDWLPAEPEEYCTLDRLVRRIPGHAMLALFSEAHMALARTAILLEGRDGRAFLVPGDKLAGRMRGMRERPRLVALVGSETAGLARQLMATASVPAVIAMQGPLTAESGLLFTSALSQALAEDGVIDRAVALARQALRGRQDEFAPVLFMSLNSGQLWRDPTGARVYPAREEKAAVSAAAAPAAARSAAAIPAVMPAAEPPADLRKAIYQALTSEGFTLDDLEELCFLNSVEWDALKGDTQPKRARAIITYFQSQRTLEALAAIIRAMRPHLTL